MVGKNPLRVAKEHGHSIATMLRAYAACAEGTTEVDVEAIKRSMNSSEAPPTNRPAVDEGCDNDLDTHGRYKTLPMRPEYTVGKLAGVAGFEPTNGGIKTRRVLVNQQVTDLIDLLVTDASIALFSNDDGRSTLKQSRSLILAHDPHQLARGRID